MSNKAKKRLQKSSTISFDVSKKNLNRYSRMRKSMQTSLILLALSLTSAEAKNGYDHYYYGNSASSYNKLNKTAIIKIAKTEVKRLTMEKKLPKSWKYIPVSEIHKVDIDNWTVTFKNSKIKSKSNQTLYVFVGTYGKIKGINYTGN